MRLAHCGLAAAVLMSSSATADPASWTPVGKWEVQFADQQCFAIREFVSGKQKAKVVLEAVPTGDGLSLNLIVPTEQLKSYFQAPVSIGSKRIAAESFGEVSMGGGPDERAVFTYLNAEEVDAVEKGGILHVGRDGRVMKTGLSSMGTVRKLLVECAADLLTHWGYSRAVQAAIAKSPEPTRKPNQLFAPADYPTGAIRRDASGRVRVLVHVGTDGQAKSCKVVLSSKDHDLDSTTCSILIKRARYTPATDSSGHAVEAPLVSTITWVLPG